MKKFTVSNVKECLNYIGIDIKRIPFTLNDIKIGMNIELEHGYANPKLNVTNDNPILTCKIALAHLLENKNYYKKLKKLNL